MACRHGGPAGGLAHPTKEARLEVTNAIAEASSNHTKWFWDGV
jgi:hypothetical protein